MPPVTLPLTSLNEDTLARCDDPAVTFPWTEDPEFTVACLPAETSCNTSPLANTKASPVEVTFLISVPQVKTSATRAAFTSPVMSPNEKAITGPDPLVRSPEMPPPGSDQLNALTALAEPDVARSPWIAPIATTPTLPLV